MKILFYNHTGQIGGAERLLLLILGRLDRRRFDPVVICPAEGPLARMVAELAVPCETVGLLKARFSWRITRLLSALASLRGAAGQLRERVVEAEPDLIHANSVRAGLVAMAATIGLGVPVIWHLHDLLPPHPLSTAIRCFAAVSARARLLAVSQAVAENFRGRVWRLVGTRGRVKVIHNAIEITKFQASPARRPAVRDELHLGGAEPVVGIIGYLAPCKGQLELLGAFAEVAAHLPRAVLLVVGAPLFDRGHDYLLRLIQAANALGIADRVRFLGPREDIPAIMQALDLLVVNSWAEGFGLVIVEAMASGTPVLATAVGGVPEIISHGKNGWLIPPRDEQTLAAAIVALSRQPQLRAEIAEQGRQAALTRFSAARYIGDLENFYRDCSQELRVIPEVRSERLRVKS